MGKNRSKARKDERKSKAGARYSEPDPMVSRIHQRRDKRPTPAAMRPEERLRADIIGRPTKCPDCGGATLVGFDCGSAQCITNKDESIFHEEV